MAAALRLYQLRTSPLRGDEAFAVRYWAAPPAQVFDPDASKGEAYGLVYREPHPLGTFLTFWAWKSLVGDSEVAMRTLSLLTNLLGVAGMFTVARLIFRDIAIATLAALLWAINPHLIWHSQDARNYAMWAALSLLGMWALLRTLVATRPTRRDWLLYVVMVAITQWIFFLEAFLIVVHGLIVLTWQPRRLRGWVISVALIGMLCTPLMWQAAQLAGSGYRGTGSGADIRALFVQFPETLLFGENAPQNAASGLAALILALSLMWTVRLRVATPVTMPGSAGFRVAITRLPGWIMLVWLVVPLALLLLAATRLDVFRPRYVIAITPALLLPLAASSVVLSRVRFALHASPILEQRFTLLLVLERLLVGGMVAVMLLSLLYHYNGSYPKAPDWYALRDYLNAAVTGADTVIMSSVDPRTGNADPAFGYYYRASNVITLPTPKLDTETEVTKALANSRDVWFVVAGSDPSVSAALVKHGTLITDDGVGRSFIVRRYRSQQVKHAEYDYPRSSIIGGVRLNGYSVLGEWRRGRTLAVLLYWDKTPEQPLTAFVHLLRADDSEGEFTMWTQDDHPPVAGRDVYRLKLGDLLPGVYKLEVGMYDPTTLSRAPITDETGRLLSSDSVILAGYQRVVVN